MQIRYLFATVKLTNLILITLNTVVMILDLMHTQIFR